MTHNPVLEKGLLEQAGELLETLGKLFGNGLGSAVSAVCSRLPLQQGLTKQGTFIKKIYVLAQCNI